MPPKLKAVDSDGADSLPTGPQNEAMGIRGMIWNNVGNMAAMAIIAGAFLYLGNDYLKQSKEDRSMFREELRELRSSQDERWNKTESAHTKAMERMSETVNRAVSSMERAAKVLEDHSRRVGGKSDGGGH